MSISAALTNAISGLKVNSRMAEVASGNIANALTEGYAQRSLETSSGFGGVQIDGISRRVDAGVLSERRLAEATLGAHQRSAQMLDRLETIVGKPGDADSIAGKLAAFETSLISAGGDPSSQTRLDNISRSLVSLVGEIRNDSADIQKMRATADTAISNDVNALNRGLKLIEKLNADYTRTKTAGQDPSSILDARQQAIDSLSGIVSLRVVPRENGQIALITTKGMTLLDGKAQEFSFEPSPIITPYMTLASGGVAGIQKNGQPVDSSNGFGRLQGGSLEAAFALRDDTLVAAQNGLDDIALDLGQRLQGASADPTLAAGDLGAISDGNIQILDANKEGLASRISVNPNLDIGAGGNSTLWRDGLGAVGAGPQDNASQLNRWSDTLSSLNSISGQPTAQTLVSRISENAAKVGQSRLQAEQDLGFAAARWDSLHNAELASGVDSDAELQNVLRIEQAYAANAKVVQALTAMIQRLMEI